MTSMNEILTGSFTQKFPGDPYNSYYEYDSNCNTRCRFTGFGLFLLWTTYVFLAVVSRMIALRIVSDPDRWATLHGFYFLAGLLHLLAVSLELTLGHVGWDPNSPRDCVVTTSIALASVVAVDVLLMMGVGVVRGLRSCVRSVRKGKSRQDIEKGATESPRDQLESN
ncbi:hypothetical protein Slin14017_G050120 [Septoria linicola]|nr:hypothetical protein Slin14017_G050120 [Septoria linicola]